VVNLQDIEERARISKGDITKLEKDISSIGAKIIADYWHSEAKFLKFIEGNKSAILEDLAQNPSVMEAEALFLTLHSRHDICHVCSHAFVQSYTQQDGILKKFKEDFCKRFKIPKDIPFYITTSFSEKRTTVHYKPTGEKIENLEGLEKIYPAFPTLKISENLL